MKTPYKPKLPTIVEHVQDHPQVGWAIIARGLSKHALTKLLLEGDTQDIQTIKDAMKRMKKENLDEIEVMLAHFGQPVRLEYGYLTALADALKKQTLCRRFAMIETPEELQSMDKSYSEIISDENVKEQIRKKMDRSTRDQREKLAIGYDRLADIVSVRELIAKLEDEELGLQLRAQKWSLTTSQKMRLDELQLQIVSLKEQLHATDNHGNRAWLEQESREVASMVRVEQLLEYHRQKQKWFVEFPSRKAIMEEIREAMLSGKSTLITGATGTGKTVLAVQVARQMQHKLVEMNHWSLIDGKLLSEELKSHPDYVHVLSGNANMTVGEIIAKIGIKAVDDGKWGKIMETTTQLGKILKAYSEGKIPIFDEIDLVPNDILMRTKHLSTLSLWERYIPQENGGAEVWIRNNIQLATANLKGAHHPDREDLDPAIVRLYQWITAWYLTKDEAYDLALVTCLWSNGSMVGISPVERQKGGFVMQIVEFMKQVENNYMGHSALWWGIDASDQYLSKAVMDIGIFAWLFAWRETNRRSGKTIRTIREYVTDNLIKFLTNAWYPLSDRKILIQMANKQWLIDASQKQAIMQRSPDLSDADWSMLLTSGESQLPAYDTETVAIMTPYEVAQLDPYQVRKIDELQWSQYVQLSELSMILSQIHGDYLMQADHIIGKLTDALLTEITDTKTFSESLLDQLLLDLEESKDSDELIQKHYDALITTTLGQASLGREQDTIDARERKRAEENPHRAWSLSTSRTKKISIKASSAFPALSSWPELDRIMTYRGGFKEQISWTIDHPEGIEWIIAVAENMIADWSFCLSVCGGLPTGEYRLGGKIYGIADAGNILNKKDYEADQENIWTHDYNKPPLRWPAHEPKRKAIKEKELAKRPSALTDKMQSVLATWAVPMHHTWPNKNTNDFITTCAALQTEKNMTQNDALLVMMYLQWLYGRYRVWWDSGCVGLYGYNRRFDTLDGVNYGASLLLSANRLLSPEASSDAGGAPLSADIPTEDLDRITTYRTHRSTEISSTEKPKEALKKIADEMIATGEFALEYKAWLTWGRFTLWGFSKTFATSDHHWKDKSTDPDDMLEECEYENKLLSTWKRHLPRLKALKSNNIDEWKEPIRSQIKLREAAGISYDHAGDLKKLITLIEKEKWVSQEDVLAIYMYLTGQYGWYRTWQYTDSSRGFVYLDDFNRRFYSDDGANYYASLLLSW